MPLQGTVQSLDSPVDLDLKVRAQDFGAESNARVSAFIEKPNGETANVLLNPSLTLPGQYEGDFLAADPGEFHVRYSVEYEDGELLEQDAFFAVSPTGPELSDTSFKESLLRDAARLSGGEYYSYRDWKSISDIPVADHIRIEGKLHNFCMSCCARTNSPIIGIKRITTGIARDNGLYTFQPLHKRFYTPEASASKSCNLIIFHKLSPPVYSMK